MSGPDPLDPEEFERRAAERRARRKGGSAKQASAGPGAAEGKPPEEPPREPPAERSREPAEERPVEPPEERAVEPPREPPAEPPAHLEAAGPDADADHASSAAEVWEEPAPLPSHLQATEAWEAPDEPSEPAAEPAEPAGARDRRAGKGGRLRPRLAAGVALVVAVGAIAWLLVALWQPFHGAGGEPVRVDVPEGASTAEIADLLTDEGVVASGTLFQIRLLLSGSRGEIQAGPYDLREGMSYGAAISELTVPPDQRTITVTIPEGLSRAEMAETVAAAGIEGDYLEATRRAEGFDPREFGAPRPVSLEGFLFPATYELHPGDDVGELVDRQLDAFREQLGAIDLRRAERRELTTFDVVTIASLIEREVSIPAERRLVSAVIHNRLRAGEPLGIDATVRFVSGNWERPLTQSELRADSPYNTRRYSGLPPGPIGSPGAGALQAAADPADSDAFYYVVKPFTCNEHEFMETAAEFEQAQRRYHEARERNQGRAPTTCPDED